MRDRLTFLGDPWTPGLPTTFLSGVFWTPGGIAWNIQCFKISYNECVMTRMVHSRQTVNHGGDVTDLSLAWGKPLGEVLLLPAEEALLLLGDHLDLPGLAPGPGPLIPSPPQH